MDKCFVNKAVQAVSTALTFSFCLSSAHAEPMQGPLGMEFYSPPTITPGEHGDLIWYRQSQVQLGEGNAMALLTFAGIVAGNIAYGFVHRRFFRFDPGSCEA